MVEMTGFFRRKKEKIPDEKILRSKYSCKYVKKGDGDKIGESIIVRGERLIVKSEERILAIPLEAVERTGEDDLLVKEFDETEAERVGEEWLNHQRDKLEFDEDGMLITEKNR
ncbi:MAG: DUF5749 family beta-barrel protein [Methanosarcinales archaeon]